MFVAHSDGYEGGLYYKSWYVIDTGSSGFRCTIVEKNQQDKSEKAVLKVKGSS